MKTKEAQDKFESLFKYVVHNCTTARAPNGKPFITVCSGGVKPEGDPVPAKFKDEDLGAWHWLYAALRTKGHHSTTLYWREEPTWEREPPTVDDLCWLTPTYGLVYSRFVTSNSPPVVNEEENDS